MHHLHGNKFLLSYRGLTLQSVILLIEYVMASYLGGEGEEIN